MKCCNLTGCIFHKLTLVLNAFVIIFCIYLSLTVYGPDKMFALLLAIPPFFSIMAIRKGGDKEERALKKRIRKALLRKELDELKKFDKEKESDATAD